MFFCPTPNINSLHVFQYMWRNTSIVPQALTSHVSSLRWMMTRWRRLIRRSLTTLHAPKRPTTSDRSLRSTTQAELSGSPITGCHAGSTPPTHRPGPCRSINLIKINELFWYSCAWCLSVSNMFAFILLMLYFTLLCKRGLNLTWYWNSRLSLSDLIWSLSHSDGVCQP